MRPMDYRKIAAVLGAILLLAPIASATHADTPPEATYSIVGGAYAVVTLNLAPQELDPQTWQPNGAAAPAGQKLLSTGTYNCATGVPASGAGTSKLSFDVVVLSDAGLTATANDHFITDNLKSAQGQPTDPYRITYGAELFVGYGSTQPAAILPGFVYFFGFLKCNGQDLVNLPPALPGQTRGIFGWADENSWTNGSDHPYAPEFELEYLKSDAADAGLVGPGEMVLTPGWYQIGGMQWLPNLGLQTNTLRWAVNPSLTEVYPGYTGSGVNGYKRSCITDDSP
ncbi:MAG TPA: hypothetical protein VNZ52_08545, partial [Candidatus Thermoplasmatota archaeon]|nr:hypothetical protein [Candidatus Thermoplasmatota archaeon]